MLRGKAAHITCLVCLLIGFGMTPKLFYYYQSYFSFFTTI